MRTALSVLGLAVSSLALAASVVGISEVTGTAPVPNDPTRYCYVLNAGEPWSCYFGQDRPTGERPVWVGAESDIPGTKR